jgi:hypothetical protein
MAIPLGFKGTVDWSGENPGISLKDNVDAPFVAFRACKSSS